MSWYTLGWLVVKAVIGAVISYGISYLTRPDAPDDIPDDFVYGSRQGDLRTQTSAYGKPMPKVFGSDRLSGNVIWAAEIKEHEHVSHNTQSYEVADGKSTDTKYRTTHSYSYSYTCSFAVGLCVGEVTAIRRVWANRKLLFDNTGDNGEVTALDFASETGLASSVTFYTGTETQIPSSIMEAVEGVGNVPAYKGLAYVVFEDLLLDEFYYQIPNLEFEIVGSVTEKAAIFSLGDKDDWGSTQVVQAPNGMYFVGWPVKNGAVESNADFNIYGVPSITVNNPTVVWNSGNLSYLAPPYSYFMFPWCMTCTDSELLVLYTNGYSAYEIQKININDHQQTSVYRSLDYYNIGSKLPNQMVWGYLSGLGHCLIVLHRWGASSPMFCLDVHKWNNKLGIIESAPEPFIVYDPDIYYTSASDPVTQIGGAFANCRPEVYMYFKDNKIVLDVTSTIYPYPDRDHHINSMLTYSWASLNSLKENIVYGQYGTIQTGVSDIAVQIGFSGEYWYTPLAGIENVCRVTGTYPYSWSINGSIWSMTLNDPVGTKIKKISNDFSTNTFSARNGSRGLSNSGRGLICMVGYEEGDTTYKKWVFQGDIDWDCMTQSTMVMPFQISFFDVALQVAASLQDVVEYALDSVDIDSANYDMSALAGIDCHGFTYTRTSTAISFLSQLMVAYNFSLVEKDWQLVAVLDGGTSVLTITEDDLGVIEDGETEEVNKIVENRTPDRDLPQQVRVSYKDLDADFVSGNVRAFRSLDAITSANKIDLDLPLVMSATQAKQMAIKHLTSLWARRTPYEFNIGPKFIKMQVGDVATVDNIKMFISQLTVNFPGLLNVSAVSEFTPAFTSNAVGETPFVDSNDALSAYNFSFLILLDIPLLSIPSNSTAMGLYAVGYGITDDWAGGFVISSNDEGITWLNTGIINGNTVVGLATTVLGSGPNLTIDESNSVTVDILTPNGSLSSVSRTALMNGTTCTFALGTHGAWEIVSFEDAVLNPDGTYTLSTLIRGRRGTDGNMDDHVVGDVFVFLGGNLSYITLTDEQLGSDISYKLVGDNTTPAMALSQTLACTGQSVLSFSPVKVEGTRDGSGNLTITWVRRSKSNQGWILKNDAPLIDDYNDYEIDILDTGVVVRTITSTDVTYAPYSAANQVIDFGTAQSSIDLIVYQMGRLGRGTGRSATI